MSHTVLRSPYTIVYVRLVKRWKCLSRDSRRRNLYALVAMEFSQLKAQRYQQVWTSSSIKIAR